MRTLGKRLLTTAGWFLLLLGCGINQQSTSSDICRCTPEQTPQADFRHNAKHVPLPGTPAQEITVSTVLTWPENPEPARDAARTGRELQMFQIAHAFLHLARLNEGDCDLHLEVADTEDNRAPRIIVETPIDSEYCSARRTLQQQLAARGITISSNSPALANAVPVEVSGLAFQDFHHPRGSPQVATTWELHPAVVTVQQ